MNSKARLILISGITLSIISIVLLLWSLFQLHAGVEHRKEAISIQNELHELYESLQTVDSDFLKFQLDKNKSNFIKILESLTLVRNKLSGLSQFEIKDKEVLFELNNLNALILDKIKWSNSFSINPFSDEKIFSRQVILHNNLIITDKVKESIYRCGFLINQRLQAHRSIIDRYFPLVICLVLFFSFSAFGLIFGYQRLVAKEISNRILLTEKLQAAQNTAIEASKLKSQFLAMVSHEIRTPLNGIIGIGDFLLKKRNLDKEAHRLVEVLSDASQSLLSILNQLLDFSKIESGRISLEMDEFQISDLIENSLKLFEAQSNKKEITLFGIIDPDLSHTLIGDKNKILQVLNNLIGNAVKFTQKGMIQVEATLVKSQSNHAELKVTIQDTGPGINNDLQKNIFKPFTQSHTTSVQRGTGLGLAISKQFIEHMNGSIGVHSGLGLGSTFWFNLTLPIKELNPPPHFPFTEFDWYKIATHDLSDQFFKRISEHYNFKVQLVDDLATLTPNSDKPSVLVLDGTHSKEFIFDPNVFTKVIQTKRYKNLHANASYTTIHSPTTLSSMLEIFQNSSSTTEKSASDAILLGDNSPESKRSILIVEDNPTNQLLAQVFLKDLSFNTETTDSGKEALRILETKSFNLILMDCQLPDISGYECTSMIRKTERYKNLKPVPIIALTANVSQRNQDECLASGMDDFLAKPYTFEQLKQKIEATLDCAGSTLSMQPIEQLDSKVGSKITNDILDSFISTLSQFETDSGLAIKSKDPKKIKELAHKVQSSAGLLGANILQTISEEIEQNTCEDWDENFQIKCTTFLKTISQTKGAIVNLRRNRESVS